MENEELKKLEEDLPRLQESDLAKAAKTYKAKTRVGCDGFHSKVPLDLAKETRQEVVEFWEKVEQSGRWPQQACATMFFLSPKSVTSERPIALMATMMRRREALRAAEVAQWQYLYRIEWDATDGPNGGRSPACSVGSVAGNGEVKISCRRKKEQGAVDLVLDLAKAFERVSLPVVWAWATHFNFPRKILRMLCGYLEHKRRVQFE